MMEHHQRTIRRHGRQSGNEHHAALPSREPQDKTVKWLLFFLFLMAVLLALMLTGCKSAAHMEGEHGPGETERVFVFCVAASCTIKLAPPMSTVHDHFE